MSNSEEQFFENLTKGGRPLRRGSGEASPPASPENDDEADSEEIALTPKFTDNIPETEGKLTIDVYQTPTEIVVESAIAGVKPEDLDINVSSDSITIRGERRHNEKIKEEDYFYQECYWGRFSRSVILPEEVDPDGATVNFKDGVLTVKLPKFTRKKTKKLKVKVE
ncbi:MAG: Hsp20 family protein [Patescibacteria group bacterium]